MQDRQTALKVINEMQEAGVIAKYAICGVVAATFYIEPTATYGIDIFVSFENVPGSSLASLEPIFKYLSDRQYKTSAAHFLIAGWQIQFLPADDALNNEALFQAVETHATCATSLSPRPDRLTIINCFFRIFGARFMVQKFPNPGKFSGPGIY